MDCSGTAWFGVGWSGLEWVGVAQGWSGFNWVGVGWSVAESGELVQVRRDSEVECSGV